MATTLTIEYDSSNDPKLNIQSHLVTVAENARMAAVVSELTLSGDGLTLQGVDDDIVNLLHFVRTEYDAENPPSMDKTTLTFVVNKSFGSVSDYLYNMFTNARSMALKSSFKPVGEGMVLNITGSIQDLHSLLNPTMINQNGNSPPTNSQGPNRNVRLPMSQTRNVSGRKGGIAFNNPRVTVKRPLLPNLRGGVRRKGTRRNRTRSRR
jgi:hypothetical protein